MVLSEALERPPTFREGITKLACGLVVDLGLDDLVPLVRELAGMSYPQELSAEQTDVIMVIQDALLALTELEDPRAVELNRARLHQDLWLQTSAVTNLRWLADWDSTPAIMGLLAGAEPSPEHLGLHLAVIEYLEASPRMPATICPAVRSLRDAYESLYARGMVRAKHDVRLLREETEDLFARRCDRDVPLAPPALTGGSLS